MAIDYQILLVDELDWLARGAHAHVEYEARQAGFEVLASVPGLLVLEIRRGYEQELRLLKDKGVTWDEAYYRQDLGGLVRINGL